MYLPFFILFLKPETQIEIASRNWICFIRNRSVIKRSEPHFLINKGSGALWASVRPYWLCQLFAFLFVPQSPAPSRDDQPFFHLHLLCNGHVNAFVMLFPPLSLYRSCIICQIFIFTASLFFSTNTLV